MWYEREKWEERVEMNSGDQWSFPEKLFFLSPRPSLAEIAVFLRQLSLTDTLTPV